MIAAPYSGQLTLLQIESFALLESFRVDDVSQPETISFPPTVAGMPAPVWNGHFFDIDGAATKILEYGACNTGWNDGLTEFHEETAGANHFIDEASREYALWQLATHIVGKNAPVVLEIGCSSGFMLSSISKINSTGTTIGADIVKEPLEKLSDSLPGIPLLRFDLSKCPLADQSVDAVVALNVLEHIEKDQVALGQIFRILKPGGIVILEVPAGPELYDDYDALLLHYRRYTLNQLVDLAVGCGFQVKRASHLGCFLYPGFWMVKQLNRSKRKSSAQIDSRSVASNITQTGGSPILRLITELELKVGRHLCFPFGIRCLLTCVKP